MEEVEDTDLHEAVRYSDVDEARIALQHGCDPNQLGAYQWSPLHEASSNGDLPLIRLLLHHKGDPNRVDGLRGCTSLHYAASEGHCEALQLLLSAGGDWQQRNNDGLTCIDVATAECRDILQNKSDTASTSPASSISDKKSAVIEQMSSSPRSDVGSTNRTDSAFDSVSIDTIGSFSSSGSTNSWQMPSKVLGHIMLSFEYHSKKKTFKIRVWKVMNLLLPPADSSMIAGIYVKSHLLPDPRKTTKRKTEVVKTNNSSTSMSSLKTHNVVFKSSSFTFTRPLEYSAIDKDTMHTLNVSIEVCLTQRYTRKSFTVASWTCPLLECTHCLVKEKYPLHPVTSTKLPENMMVYHGGHLESVPNTVTRSNPSLQHQTSSASWGGCSSERAFSDPQLDAIKVEGMGEKTPSIEINIPQEENNDEELNEALIQIAIMEKKQTERTVLEMNERKVDADESLSDVRIGSTPKEIQAEIHMPHAESQQLGANDDAVVGSSPGQNISILVSDVDDIESGSEQAQCQLDMPQIHVSSKNADKTSVNVKKSKGRSVAEV